MRFQQGPIGRLQRLASNSGWLLADQMLRIGLGALLTIWVARHFGPERLGAYNYAIALVSLAAPLAAFGLDSLVVRDLVRAPGNASRILASAALLRLCTGCLSILGAIGLALLARPDDRETMALALIAASAGLFQSVSVLDLWFQSQLESKYSVLARDVAFLAAACLKVWCILSYGSILLLSWAILLEACLTALLLWLTYCKVNHPTQDERNVDWSLIKGYALEARSLVLTGLLIAVYMRVDRVIIGSLLDNRSVGIYSVAVQLCEIFYVLPTVAISSLYPVLVNLYERDHGLYTRRLTQVMRLFFYAGVGIAVLFLLFADRVVLGLFGDRFYESVQITKIYIFMLPLVGMSIIFSHRYVLNGTPRYSLLGVAAGGGVTVLLNYLLVPHWGLQGAAGVALLSQIIPTVFVTLLADKSVGLIFLRAMLPTWGKDK